MVEDLLPFISVIMAVRNEARHVQQSVAAVLDQDYPPTRMEIIVADGDSSDGTLQILRDIASRDPRVRLISNKRRSTPSGLNAAIRCSTGEIVARVDGRSIIARDYLQRSIEVLRATRAAGVGGLQRPVAIGLTGRAIALAICFPFGVGNAHFRYRRYACWTNTVYLGVYRRQTLHDHGYFDEEMERNQDDELNLRLCQAGGRLRLDPQIASTYYCRGDFRSLWDQYYCYGLYKVRVMQKRRCVTAFRHVAPSLFVLAAAASMLTAAATARATALAPILGAYCVANVASSLYLARNDRAAAALVPLVFLVLHLSYGIGFIAGLWRFRRHFVLSSTFGRSPCS